MSSQSSPAPASPSALYFAIFGLAMFALGLAVGSLALPLLSGTRNTTPPAQPTQATVIAQLPATTISTITPTSIPATATTISPTATPPPPTATVAPTATPLPPTATPLPPTATRPPSSIFAPEPTEQPAANATGTTTAVPAATSTTTPAATATATPATAFTPTDRVNTELPVNFRAGPGTTYSPQGALPPGTPLAATGEQQTTDGVLWRQFRIANGTIGWIRAQDVLAIQ